MQDRVGEIVIPEEGKSYRLGEVTFGTPVRHVHGEVETYLARSFSPMYRQTRNILAEPYVYRRVLQNSGYRSLGR